MMGILLSLVATLAVLIFAFYSDDSHDYAGSRLRDSDRRISKQSGDVERVDRITDKLRQAPGK
jgi:hypothetical protein